MTPCRRGQIWYANLNPTVGREHAGDRPCLVVSSDLYHAGQRALVVICPLTSTLTNVPIHVRVDPPDGGLSVSSIVLCDQIRAVSSHRLRRHAGDLSTGRLAEVEDRLRILLEL